MNSNKNLKSITFQLITSLCTISLKHVFESQTYRVQTKLSNCSPFLVFRETFGCCFKNRQSQVSADAVSQVIRNEYNKLGSFR